MIWYGMETENIVLLQTYDHGKKINIGGQASKKSRRRCEEYERATVGKKSMLAARGLKNLMEDIQNIKE
jgi:hypothetical protein